MYRLSHESQKTRRGVQNVPPWKRHLGLISCPARKPAGFDPGSFGAPCHSGLKHDPEESTFPKSHSFSPHGIINTYFVRDILIASAFRFHFVPIPVFDFGLGSMTFQRLFAIKLAHSHTADEFVVPFLYSESYFPSSAITNCTYCI